MTEAKSEHQRPEGRLIERALAGPPKVSFRELARRVGMSDARVRQIVNGYASQGGQAIEVIGPALTLARMASSLGISADDMSEAGREDAAEAMTNMTNLRTVGTLPDGKLWMHEDKAPELKALREWLERPDGDRPPTPPLSALSLWRWDQLFVAARARVEDELELLRFTVDAVSRHAFPSRRGGERDAPRSNSTSDTPAAGPAEQPATRDDFDVAANESAGDPLQQEPGAEEGPSA